eukprot:465860_1
MLHLILYIVMLVWKEKAKCFAYGANMVTKQVLNIIGNKGFNGLGKYTCPYYGMNNLTEDELWHHIPLYHINDNNATPLYSQTQTIQPCDKIKCPICGKEEKRNRSFFFIYVIYYGDRQGYA